MLLHRGNVMRSNNVVYVCFRSSFLPLNLVFKHTATERNYRVVIAGNRIFVPQNAVMQSYNTTIPGAKTPYPTAIMLR